MRTVGLSEENQIETYFMKELIPHVEKNFPTNSLRGIAGLSMGGHGAFVLSLRNPGVFSSVSSMSGILDITLHTKKWHLVELFGPYEGEYMADWERIRRSSSYSAMKVTSALAHADNSLPGRLPMR